MRIRKVGAGLLLAVGLFAVAAGSAQAQDRVAAVLSRMRENLKLTDEQAKKVEAILKEEFAQVAKDREMAKDDDKKAAELAKARRTKYDALIDAALTPEQRVQRSSMKNERRKKRTPAVGGATASPAPKPGASPAAKPSVSPAAKPSAAPSPTPKPSPKP